MVVVMCVILMRPMNNNKTMNTAVPVTHKRVTAVEVGKIVREKTVHLRKEADRGFDRRRPFVTPLDGPFRGALRTGAPIPRQSTFGMVMALFIAGPISRARKQT